MSESSRVALSIEVNESIYKCLQDFLAANPQWTQEQLINASMSLFLLQNHKNIVHKDNQSDYGNYSDSVRFSAKKPC